MKFTLAADAIRPAVEACASIAPGEGKKPQLESTLITVNADGTVQFAATNTADALWFKVAGATDVEPGPLFVPSVNLLRLVKQADDEKLTVTWDETKGQAIFTFAESRIKLPVEDPKDFPQIQRFDPKGHFVTLPLPALSMMFKRVNFAVMDDFRQRTLAGVNVQIKAKSLKLTTTDGVRMATVERDIDNPTGVRTSTIIPPLPPKIIKTFSIEDEDPVDVQVTDTAIALRGTRGELTRRAINGQFPDWDLEKQLVYQHHIEVPTKSLKEVLETAALLKVNSPTTCEFNWTADGLLLEASSGIDGNVRAKLAAPWPHPPFSIRLDAALLAEAVKCADADQVDLSFGDERQPALLREMQDGLLYLYAISPKF